MIYALLAGLIPPLLFALRNYLHGTGVMLVKIAHRDLYQPFKPDDNMVEVNLHVALPYAPTPEMVGNNWTYIGYWMTGREYMAIRSLLKREQSPDGYLYVHFIRRPSGCIVYRWAKPPRY